VYPKVSGLAACRCSFIAVLLVSLVSFAAITLLVASQRMFYCCKRIFRYRLIFGYALLAPRILQRHYMEVNGQLHATAALPPVPI